MSEKKKLKKKTAHCEGLLSYPRSAQEVCRQILLVVNGIYSRVQTPVSKCDSAQDISRRVVKLDKIFFFFGIHGIYFSKVNLIPPLVNHLKEKKVFADTGNPGGSCAPSFGVRVTEGSRQENKRVLGDVGSETLGFLGTWNHLFFLRKVYKL